MYRISETGGWKSCISSWLIHSHCSRCLFPTVDPLVLFSSRLSSQEFIFSSSPGAQFLTLTIKEFIWNYSYSFFFQLNIPGLHNPFYYHKQPLFFLVKYFWMVFSLPFTEFRIYFSALLSLSINQRWRPLIICQCTENPLLIPISELPVVPGYWRTPPWSVFIFSLPPSAFLRFLSLSIFLTPFFTSLFPLLSLLFPLPSVRNWKIIFKYCL